MALCEVLARDPRYAIDVVSTIEKLDEQGFIHKVVARGFELETDERIFAPKECDPVPLSKISGRFAGIYRFREGHGNGAKRGDRRPPISTLSAKAIPRFRRQEAASRLEDGEASWSSRRRYEVRSLQVARLPPHLIRRGAGVPKGGDGTESLIGNSRNNVL
jgi:hypothetical protein